MHKIYHTEALVLGSKNSGEDSKTIFLYTRELGLVYAKAQGVRKISSKLRFTLQNFSLAQVDLVRGKEIWRITTAVPISNNTKILEKIRTNFILSRVATLVVRLVAGEDRNDELFSLLLNICESLEIYREDEEELKKIELFYVAQILMSLGYLSREAFGVTALQGGLLPESFANPDYRRELVKEVNQALSQTQL